MAEVVTFPDVEALLVTYLDALIPEKVATKVPDPRPAALVRVMRTGGPRRAVNIEAAQITVQTWAGTEVAAAELAQRVRGLIHAAESFGTVEVLKVDEFSGPQNLPDPLTALPRYSFTMSITLGV